MTKLSVNINKIATLRNARGGNVPNLLQVATDLQRFGAQGITIKDQNGNKIVLSSDGIVIESSKALGLKASTEGKFESGTSLDVTAGTALTCEGTASNDIKSGGVVKVAGSAIQLG